MVLVSREIVVVLVLNDFSLSGLKPINCQRCDESNQATNKFCSRCGLPLDEEAMANAIKKSLERNQADDVMDELLEDSEFRKVFMKKLYEIKSLREAGTQSK